MFGANNLSELTNTGEALNNLGFFRVTSTAELKALPTWSKNRIATNHGLAAEWRWAIWLGSGAFAEDAVYIRPNDFTSQGVWQVFV